MAQYAEERAAVAASAIADPAPLGLSGFALTTFVLSATNAGLIPAAQGAIVVSLAIFYGGIAQLLAGMWEFRRGNTFGALAFTSYGAFWLAVGYGLQIGTVVPAHATSFGYFLLGWTIFTALMLLATLRTNLALMGVFVFLLLAFIALDIATLGGGGATWLNIGGWLGIITALIAWYTALAGVLTTLPSVFKLPVFPRS